MQKNLFIKAEEIAEIAKKLGASKPYAYKLIRKLNEELKNRGFITISGKVSRQFFEEKIYGLRKEESYVGLQR